MHSDLLTYFTLFHNHLNIQNILGTLLEKKQIDKYQIIQKKHITYIENFLLFYLFIATLCAKMLRVIKALTKLLK